MVGGGGGGSVWARNQWSERKRGGGGGAEGQQVLMRAEKSIAGTWKACMNRRQGRRVKVGLMGQTDRDGEGSGLFIQKGKRPGGWALGHRGGEKKAHGQSSRGTAHLINHNKE